MLLTRRAHLAAVSRLTSIERFVIASVCCAIRRDTNSPNKNWQRSSPSVARLSGKHYNGWNTMDWPRFGNGVGTTVKQFDRATFDDIFAFRLRLSELIGDFPASSEIPTALNAVKTLLEPARQAKDSLDKTGFWQLNHKLQLATSSLIDNHALRETHERYYFQACRIWYRRHR